MSAIYMIALMDISIHAPHARSDPIALRVCHAHLLISIHAPHARSDRRYAYQAHHDADDFNPRSSCEERRADWMSRLAENLFQSTLLMRGATRTLAYPSNTDVIQSTLLMRGATNGRRHG